MDNFFSLDACSGPMCLTKLQISWILLPTLSYKISFLLFTYVCLNFHILQLWQCCVCTFEYKCEPIVPGKASVRFLQIFADFKLSSYSATTSTALPKTFFNMGKRQTFGSPGKISEMFLIGPNGSPCSSNLQTWCRARVQQIWEGPMVSDYLSVGSIVSSSNSQ